MIEAGRSPGGPRRRSRSGPRRIVGALGVVVVAAFVLVAPAARAGADTTTPATPLPASKVKVTHNVAYTEVDGITLTLDIYEPEDPGTGRPGILLIHGGAWGTGQAKDLDEQGRLVARQGWVAFSVNYRLSDSAPHPWPDELTDVQRAARWMGAHADDHGVDPQRLGVIGFSAGGHLAAMLAEIGTAVDGTGATIDDPNPPVQIRAAIALSPPTRLAGLIVTSDGGDPPDCQDNSKCSQFWHLPLVEHFMGCHPEDCPAAYRAASPVTRATSASAPIWFANSSEEIIGISQATAFDQALTAAGVDHHFEQVQGSKHAGDLDSTVWNTMMPWMAGQLGVAEPPPISFSGRNILLSPVVVISVVVGLALLIVLLAMTLRDDDGEL